MVSPNSREGIYIYILYSLVLILYLKCGGGWGGGGCNVFLTFYAISNISRKNLGIQNNYFSFNVFFMFFLYAGNIVKCPFTLIQLLILILYLKRGGGLGFVFV